MSLAEYRFRDEQGFAADARLLQPPQSAWGCDSRKAQVIAAVTWGRLVVNAGVGVGLGLVFIAVGIGLSRRGQTQIVPGDVRSPKAERARGSLAATGLVLVAFGALFILLALVATVISLISGHPV